MNRGPTGSYVVSKLAGEAVRAFLPFSLPPHPPLEMSVSTHKKLEKAQLALGRLDSITLLLPEPGIFLYSYIRREAVLSSQIEGTQSTLTNLLLFELDEAPGVPVDDVVEVSNYVAAMEYGISRLHAGFPLSNRLLREMHGRLLGKGRGSDKSPGNFRTTQNWIGGTRPGNALFVPPPPEHLPDAMASLEKYFHDDSVPYPTLIKTALAHVQFETIHPFLDGNGRIGRLLISFLLHQQGVLSRPLLYLSLYLKQHRKEYYRLLDLVRHEGDWEAWVDFFLEGVEETARNAVETAQSLIGLFERDSRQITASKKNSTRALLVFDMFRRKPILTVNEICQGKIMTHPTATAAIHVLQELGIVREISGRQRNRVFAYADYLKILNAEA